MSNVFKNFTNLYELSKTLRFELKPVGKTLDNMRDHLRFDKDMQTFLADQEIEDAYQTLKPVLDYLHEEFITESLESDVVANIDFFEYWSKYQHKKDLKEKDLENTEKELRSEFAKVFEKTANDWKVKAGKNEKNKDILKDKSYKILTENGILQYISKNAEKFSDIKSIEEINNALKSFEGFFTYFSGFNKNRENYYETGKEASTAVATRIINENLPKFCDNILFFENRKEEYLSSYNFLEKMGRHLVNKEGKKLFEIQDDIFQITAYNKYLSQKQIEKYNEQIGNANFVINLYNQAKREEKGFRKLPLFKNLYKQIGCGKRKSLYFTLTHDKKNDADIARNNGKEAFSVEEIIELAQIAGEKYFYGVNDDNEINTVRGFLEYIKNRKDYHGVYWSKVAINTISNKYFTNWYALKEELKNAKVFEKAAKGIEEDIKIPEVIELEGLFLVLDQISDWKEILFKKSIIDDEEKSKYIRQAEKPSQALLNMICGDIEMHCKSFFGMTPEILELSEYKNPKDKETIKIWLDNALSVNQMLKYFLVKENKIKGNPLDSTISQALDLLLGSSDAEWFKWYDALRNYLTKKPQDDAKENKLKLNFENSTLAGGWDVNKEPDNYCVLLQSPEKRQYLAIIAKQEKIKGYNKIFVQRNDNPLYKTENENVWQKIDYKLLPGPNKMLPKCLLPKSQRTKYGANQDILDLYDGGTFKKTEKNFVLSDAHKLIEFYKQGLQKYKNWQCFDFDFKKTTEYEDISQFYSDVERQGYKLDFVDINKSVIDQWVEEGKIYLFEIRNQDYNDGKKVGHKNNLHTIYWKSLFENIINRPKLNGEAELFYRKAIPIEKLEKIIDKNGIERIKNYRFVKEKFLFHVPIKLNFCYKKNRMNDFVNSEMVKSDNLHFLGIDRGEKHLAYYSLLDSNGVVVDQGTLNMPFLDKDGKQRLVKAEKRMIDDNKEITKEVFCKDYNELLEAKAGDRNYARKNWQTIGTIKELKAGYISQVVRKIADIAVKHNAFIVLEDLNTGFKRGRQKIEKSVYQKFELALAKKLNFLVDKNVNNSEFGSVTNALQLTPLVNNYGDIEGKKQAGIMLYTRANYTSQTDPVTGWRKSIYLQKGSEESIKSQIINNFKDIGFDGKDYYFDYIFGEEIDKKTGEIISRVWRLYSGFEGKSLDRFRGKRKDKNEWVIEKQNIVEILDGLFVDFSKERSLLSQIVEEDMSLTRISKHTAWESLRFAIDLIQQIRNTGLTEVDSDFLVSPVRDINGKHFDSRLANDKQPNSGDANGAYNIARKGLLMNEHIKLGYNLFISDSEWDAWLAGKEIWGKWINNSENLKKYLVRKKQR